MVSCTYIYGSTCLLKSHMPKLDVNCVEAGAEGEYVDIPADLEAEEVWWLYTDWHLVVDKQILR